MIDSIQDEPQLPVLATKKKKRRWLIRISVAVVSVIVLMLVAGVIYVTVIFMRAGSSPEDYIQSAIDAVDSDQVETDETTTESPQDTVDQTVDGDSSTPEQSDSRDYYQQDSIE